MIRPNRADPPALIFASRLSLRSRACSIAELDDAVGSIDASTADLVDVVNVDGAAAGDDMVEVSASTEADDMSAIFEDLYVRDLCFRERG